MSRQRNANAPNAQRNLNVAPRRGPDRNARGWGDAYRAVANAERHRQVRDANEEKKEENSQASDPESESEAASSSSSVSAVRQAGRGVKSLHLTDREAFKKDVNRPFEELNLADIPAGNSDLYWVMDIEVHSMQKENKFVSQITAVPLRGVGKSFNAYVFLRRLQKPWMDLVESGQVELAKWDDETVAKPFPKVWVDLCNWLPPGSVLLFKGTADKAVIQLSLNVHGADGEDAINFGNSRGITLQSIDSLWWDACQYLPPQAAKIMFGKRGDKAKREGKFPIARPLGAIYDALFWNTLLIKVEEKSEELVEPDPDYIDVLPQFDDQNDDEMPMEFIRQKHLQPVWHTSHTDTLATRNITCFLFWWIHERHRLRADIVNANDIDDPSLLGCMRKDVSSDDLVLHILATSVAHKTNLFRSGNLSIPPSAYAFAAYSCQKQKKHQIEIYRQVLDGVFDDSDDDEVRGIEVAAEVNSEVDDDATIAYGDDDPEADADIDVYRILDDRKLHSTDKARKKLLDELQDAAAAVKIGLVVKHKGEWVLVHTPRNRDATKLRAAKSKLGIRDARRGDRSRYDVLEEQRRRKRPLSRPVDDRPHYYYPTATGSQGVGVQVLHTRKCLDRKNGHNNPRAVAAPADSDKIALYDFDSNDAVICYSLRFCKECKQYEVGARDEVSELFADMAITSHTIYVHTASPYIPNVQCVFDKLSDTEPIKVKFNDCPLIAKESDDPIIVFASVNAALGMASRMKLKELDRENGQKRLLVICSQSGDGLDELCATISKHSDKDTFFTGVAGLHWNRAKTRYPVNSDHKGNNKAYCAIGDFLLDHS